MIAGPAGLVLRKIMELSPGNLDALKELLPTKELHGKDFETWPKQCLVLHFFTKVRAQHALLTQNNADALPPTHYRSPCVFT